MRERWQDSRVRQRCKPEYLRTLLAAGITRHVAGTPGGHMAAAPNAGLVHIIGQQRARSARLWVVIHNVKRTIIWGNQDTIGRLHVIDNARQRTIQLNAIDRHAILFHIIFVSIARVGEIDAPLRIKTEIVGGVELFAVVVASQRCNTAIGFITAYGPRAIIFAVAANNQSTRCIKVHAVSAQAGLLPHLRLTSGGTIEQNAIIGAVRKIDIAIGIRSGTFSKGATIKETLKARVGGDWVLGHYGSPWIGDKLDACPTARFRGARCAHPSRIPARQWGDSCSANGRRGYWPRSPLC